MLSLEEVNISPKIAEGLYSEVMCSENVLEQGYLSAAIGPKMGVGDISATTHGIFIKYSVFDTIFKIISKYAKLGSHDHNHGNHDFPSNRGITPYQKNQELGYHYKYFLVIIHQLGYIYVQ